MFVRRAHNSRCGSELLSELQSFDERVVLRCTLCFNVAFRQYSMFAVAKETNCARGTQRFDGAVGLLREFTPCF